MNRTFHSKVSWIYWLIILITAFLLLDFFWFHYLLLTLLFAVVMIMEIEMLIHTQYIITSEGVLRIETGRFIPNIHIDVKDIIRIRKVKSITVAPALSFERLEVTYRKDGKTGIAAISPKNEDDFIKWLQKRNPDIQYSQKND